MERNKSLDTRLIEAGFPCHQVGAETQRERGASSALPPLYFLHVWWARRPLTPSRAAILGSLLPADTDPEWFLRQLGIEKKQAVINGERWTLVGKNLEFIEVDEHGREYISINSDVLKALRKENERRARNREIIKTLLSADASFEKDELVARWANESRELSESTLQIGNYLEVVTVAADPAHVNERIAFASSAKVKQILGSEIRWDAEDLYGYGRAYETHAIFAHEPMTILDPTAGGGSIPFEAMRLGYNVIANDLNPVATVIQHATLEYPAKFGESLISDIIRWGNKLVEYVEKKMEPVTPFSRIPESEYRLLKKHCTKCPELIEQFDKEFDYTGILYARQVTCPHCGGEAPLLNTCWLSKEGEKWGVRIVTDGQKTNGKVHFETYRINGSRGPNGEDPNFATVDNGVGTCIHCRQAISSEEIKAQARGESVHGTWKDRLYCVVAVRYQPKLDKNGRPERYKSGEKAGEIKTEKVRYFRPPNQADLEALALAERMLAERWDEWDAKGYIPTEKFPEGNDMRPVNYGMTRWCDMFTPRQLLGHLFLVEKLNEMKPDILRELGEERGRAVVTYLQFAIDKCLDYNSRQTLWHAVRGVIAHTFTRHDYSFKWTFGELIMAGVNSGVRWALDQIIDAYKGIVSILPKKINQRIRIVNGSAANMNEVDNQSIDLICMDPPYYNNVQYAELSDYFYVWQKRTLHDLFTEVFNRRLTNKQDEAVANPARDGSPKRAGEVYESLMGEIFLECRRVLKNDGIMTIMFTHKSQNAWEALTRSIIDSGFEITACMPVESESKVDIHHKDMAAAASSIFLTCRKRLDRDGRMPSIWSGFGSTGVLQQIREAVREGLKEFEVLKLNPVDEMVASYGRALRVLSENWPVMDGDEQVSPTQAMTEASAVVAQFQIRRLTQGRLSVEDLNAEAAMALTLFGIYGMNEIAYSDALNLSKSLNIRLEHKPAGYQVQDRMIGINDERGAARSGRNEGRTGYFAPLVKKGSKLRLAHADERAPERLLNPQTEWDILQGVLMAYEEGQEPVARAYMQKHAANKEAVILDLLNVWANKCGDEFMQRKAERILFGFKR